MENKKQTAVAWLISQLQKSKDWHRVLNEISQISSAKIDIIEQAKEMEKQQKIDFANRYADDVMAGCLLTAEQYYKEEYGS